MCIVKSKNAIPTIFESRKQVGTFGGFGAAIVSIMSAAVTRRVNKRLGRLASFALVILNFPLHFSLYRAFPPLMIDTRLKNAGK